MRNEFESRTVARLAAAEATCCWPHCENRSWFEIELPLCQKHAARTHLVVGDMVPKTVDEKRAVRSRAASTREGVIYFMEYGELIKIGFTTNLAERLYKIRGRGVLGKVLATVPGTMRDEKAVLMRFGEHWEHGEYYRPGPSLMRFIDTLKPPADAVLTDAPEVCEDGKH